jgi:hydrogenase expression/formation protein HypD
MKVRYEELLRDKELVRTVIKRIDKLGIRERVNLMEVCGTHTYTFFRFGLRKILPPYINLVSGPGCPVCITEDSFIDKAILLARDKKNVIATFGDLVRVRGSSSSLEEEKSKGAKLFIVYSPREALDYASTHLKKRIIFLGVGFETTAPLIASIVKEAKQKKLKNFFLLSSHRLIPPAMEALCKDKEIKIQGFICPGHVSAIIGERPYAKIVREYKKGCVISGFEPLDMLVSIYLLLLQIKEGSPKLENQYSRVVKPQGNPIARKLLKEVFTVKDAGWRGFGVIKKSGLELNNQYRQFDAHKLINQHSKKRDIYIKDELNFKNKRDALCLCAEVVKGKISPLQCPQFRKACTPVVPLGPCMISFEGTCRIHYEYEGTFDKIIK